MGSQTDLDQGGTFRQTQLVYMGPTIGWVRAANQVILPITAAGTTTVQKGNSLITVSVNANGVVIQLPTSIPNPAGAGAIPGDYPIVPLTIVDIGGFAASHPISILPFGAETIDGLASLSLDTPYGAFVLRRKSPSGWTLTQ